MTMWLAFGNAGRALSVNCVRGRDKAVGVCGMGFGVLGEEGGRLGGGWKGKTVCGLEMRIVV